MGATAAVSLMVAGTGISAVGQYRAGQAEGAAAQRNAFLADQQADDAIRRGFLDSARHLSQVRRMTNEQRAGYAGSGVDAFSGSAADVRRDTSILGEVDALTIKTNAAKEAFGLRHQAESYRGAGNRARKAGTFGAISTLLTGGAQAYFGGKSVQSGKPEPSAR